MCARPGPRRVSPPASPHEPTWRAPCAEALFTVWCESGSPRDACARKGIKLCPIGPPTSFGVMQALDELVARWRKNPDSEATQALCAHLGTSRQSDLMREVGNA